MNSHLIYQSKGNGKLYPGKNGGISYSTPLSGVNLSDYRKCGENALFNIYEPKNKAA